MNFKKWVKSIQTAGYNGARTVNVSDLIYSSNELRRHKMSSHCCLSEFDRSVVVNLKPISNFFGVYTTFF